VLVDRIWPRGMSRQRAGISEWCKQVAPSAPLRQWYGHDPARHEECARRYRGELASGEQAAALGYLRQLAEAGLLTLLTATKQCEISQAGARRPAERDIAGPMTGSAPGPWRRHPARHAGAHAKGGMVR
jgi:uncharacterized protein YeaO (DUF488 family)